MYATNHLKGNFHEGKLSKRNSSRAIILSGGTMIRGGNYARGNCLDTIINSYIILKKPILKKCPGNIILHVGTNNAAREPPIVVFDKLLSLKSFIEKTLPNCKISISNLIKRTDNNEAAKTVDKVNELLFTLQLDIVDNNNITKNELSRKGLHLNDIGDGKLAVNFIRKIKNFKRS